MPPRKRRPPEPPKPPEPPVEPSAGDRAKLARQDLLRKWQARVSRAREVRATWERTFRIEQAEKYFIGQQQEQKEHILNRFWATLRTSRPTLLYAAPKFFVRPAPGRTEPATESVLATAEGLLDAIALRDENLKHAGKLALLQAYFRLGVLKVIYDPRLEPNPKKGEPIYRTTERGEPVKDDLGANVPVRDPMTGAVVLEPDEVLVDEVYRWQWVDAAALLLPDEGPDPESWTWIGEEISVPLASAQDDPRFPAGIRSGLRANATATRPRAKSAEPPGGMGGEAEEMFRYLECYDLRQKRWAVWAEGQIEEDFLVEEPMPTWIEAHPYALLILGDPILGPESIPWPFPLVHPWLDPQREYNIRRQQVMEGAKRAARKILYEEQSFADFDEAFKGLQSPSDLEAVKVTDINRPPRVLEIPPLNMDIHRDLGYLDADWRVITGQSGARLQDPDKATATESAFIERSAGVRESEMQDSVNDWLATAGRKMLQAVKETLTLGLWIRLRAFDDKEFMAYMERVYRIPKEALAGFPALKQAFRERFGAEKWLRVQREALQFEADVRVFPGSTRPRNLDWERRQWLEFLQILGQYPQLALNRELLRETAAKFEGISERIIDELTATAERMVEIQARQAGRTQGGAPGDGAGAGGSAASPIVSALLSGATGGAR